LEKLFSDTHVVNYFKGLDRVLNVGTRIVASIERHTELVNIYFTNNPTVMVTTYNTHIQKLKIFLTKIGRSNLISIPPTPISLDYPYLLNNQFCSLSLCAFRLHEKRITWGDKQYNIDCANYWTNRISPKQPLLM